MLVKEQFWIECCQTKTKPITYQLDYSGTNLKPWQNQTKVIAVYLFTSHTQSETALSLDQSSFCK